MRKALCAIVITAIVIASFLFAKSGYDIPGDKLAEKNTSEQNGAVRLSGSISELRAAIERKVFPERDYRALNYEKQVGVWISYIDLAGMMKDTSHDEFRESIRQAYKNIVSIGGNTVYVHVRAFSDAYYPSVMYPYTYAFGESEPYDALEIMIDEAHKLGLSFHAWINPMRCGKAEDFEAMSDTLELKGFYTEHYGEYVCSAEGSPYLWLDPGSSEVRDYICAAASEIASRYDVDGIHIDDYFYPTTSEAFDSVSFEKSGADDLSQWRRSNITKLVLQMNMQIKKTNPTVVFEISPQGNISNNYTQMFADVESWCASTLICDNMIPQVYFGYNSSSPYLETIDKWSEMADGSGVKLIIGLGVYKIGEESEFRTTDKIIAKQIADALELPNVSGVALYNYSTLFSTESGLSEKMDSERDAITDVLSADEQESLST